MIESISPLKIIVLFCGLCGWGYAFYCQTRARELISKEKIAELKDPSIIATGPMPPKEILSEEGLKYHKGALIGGAIFMVSIVLAIFMSVVLKI